MNKNRKKCQPNDFHDQGQCNFGQEKDPRENMLESGLGMTINQKSTSVVLQAIRWG